MPKRKAGPGEQVCIKDSCEYPVKVRKMCKTHYEDWLSKALPEEKAWRKKITLTDDDIVSLFKAHGVHNRVASEIGV